MAVSEAVIQTLSSLHIDWQTVKLGLEGTSWSQAVSYSSHVFTKLVASIKTRLNLTSSGCNTSYSVFVT